MSHVLRRQFSNNCMIALWPASPPPGGLRCNGAIYTTIRGECRYDNPRHTATGSLSIGGYRLEKGVVEHMDKVFAQQKIVGTEIFIRKPSVRGFFGGC
jgi:hypothetical protein